MVGGILVGILTLYFVNHQRRPNKTKDSQVNHQEDKGTDKMLDGRALPGELSSQQTVEMGGGQGFAREMWVDPAELPGSPSLGQTTGLGNVQGIRSA